LDRIVDYRNAVAERVHVRVSAIDDGAVGAPAQLRVVAKTLLVALVNHEYQHDKWIGEVRSEAHGRDLPPVRPRHSSPCSTAMSPSSPAELLSSILSATTQQCSSKCRSTTCAADGPAPRQRVQPPRSRIRPRIVGCGRSVRKWALSPGPPVSRLALPGFAF
jgi:hypothetical protein